MFRDSIDMVLGYNRIEQLENETNDITIYAASKLIKLIIDQNPNAMEALWVDEEDILFANETYYYLRGIRKELLSKQSKHKYAGYAISQLNRIKGHNKWLSKEQEGRFIDKPHISQYITHVNNTTGMVGKADYKDLYTGKVGFYLLDQPQYYYTKVKDEIYNVWWDRDKSDYPLIQDGNNFIPVQEYWKETSQYKGIIWFNKSQFQSDLDEYSKWKKWKDNRNDTRHELEEKYGYDSKHAMHTFRLLKTGCEILEEEIVKVKRPDSGFLLDVRNGKYTYEWVIEQAEMYDKELLPRLYNESKLRNSIHPKVYVDIMKKILGV